MGIGKRLIIVSGLMALGVCTAPAGCGPVHPPGAGGAGGTSASDAGACGCFTHTLSWAPFGGFDGRSYTEQSSISPCRTYTHEWDYKDDRPSATCTRDVQDCATSLAGTRLDALLLNSDVRVALLRGAVLPVLYGQDTTRIDIPVFRISFGGARIDVGAPCGSPPGGSTPECEPIPAGVQSLADLLRGLEQQELSGPACVDAFP